MMTDENGDHFPAKAGTHQLVITHTGYKKNITEIKIEAQETIILDFVMSPIDQMGEVVVLGSRSILQRSNLNTPVPVDAISSKQLRQTGQPSLTQMMNFAVPSFNTSRQLLNESVTSWP
jgi:iron complex outermembrane receptor protein